MTQGRCYLCLQNTKFKDSLLCTNCFCRLQDYKYISCTRCGHSSCSGCEKLHLFKHIQCEYVYKDVLANILLQSKESNNLLAQKVFFEIFFIPIKTSLTNLLLKKKYDYIIISPLRKNRITSGSWHPNDFYDKVLCHIFSHDLKNILKPKILFPFYLNKKEKQSLIPSHKRLEIKNKNYQLIYNELNEDESFIDKNILLLDDVLTTGETALLCKNLSDKYFIESDWDLFTILRTQRQSSL